MPNAPGSWTYVQTSGELFRPDGTICAVGYSGRGDGLNNATFQSIENIGPLPQGSYILGQAKDHPMLGPEAIPLIPSPTNNMFGRSHFYCHGDNQHHDKSASEGCIIMDRPTRNELAQAKGKVLIVVDKIENRPLVA